ncbi:hypothetical protein ATB98_06155 [Sinorhizobium saheli]|uniref:Uncharacterized protein n=1 Tax=Sinorhizobium saheli TaxID=36856 RepID=A0A178Y352_SINSA|nr:hypothetical protein ATB98_06155 [Sinorhizobium saheli]
MRPRGRDVVFRYLSINCQIDGFEKDLREMDRACGKRCLEEITAPAFVALFAIYLRPTCADNSTWEEAFGALSACARTAFAR